VRYSSHHQQRDDLPAPQRCRLETLASGSRNCRSRSSIPRDISLDAPASSLISLFADAPVEGTWLLLPTCRIPMRVIRRAKSHLIVMMHANILSSAKHYHRNGRSRMPMPSEAREELADQDARSAAADRDARSGDD